MAFNRQTSNQKDLLLGFKVSRDSIARAKRMINGLKNDLRSLRDAEQDLAHTELQAIRIEQQQAIALRNTALATQAQRDATVRATEAQRRFNEAQEAFIAGGGGGGMAGARSGQSGVSRAGAALFQAPSVPLGPSSTDQVGRLLRGLGRVNVSFGQLAIGAAAVAPVLALTVVAFSAYKNALEEANERTKAFAEAVREAFKAATTDSITELVKGIEADTAALAATNTVLREELNTAANAQVVFLEDTNRNITNFLNQAAVDVRQTFGEDIPDAIETARPAILDALTSQELNSQLEENERQIRLNEVATEAYNRVLGTNEVAQNDAAQALEAATKAQKELNAELSERLAAENVAQAAAIEKKRGDAIQELTTRMFEATESIRALKQEIIDIAAAADEAVAKVQARETEAIAKAQLRESDRLAKAAQTAANAREDLQAALDGKLIKLAEDRAAKLLQITRRFNRSFSNAVGERDALAALQAEQQAADELADLDAAQKRELRAIDRFQKDKLRVIERRLAQENAAARQAATRAIATAQQKAAAEIAIIRRQAQQAIALRQQEIQVQFALLNGARARRLQLMQANIQTTIIETNIITRLWQNMLLAIRGMTTAATAPVAAGGGGGGGILPTPFASGAFIAQDMNARLHAGEVVLNVAQQRQLGIKVNVTAGGSNAQIRRAVDRRLNQTLVGAGIT